MAQMHSFLQSILVKSYVSKTEKTGHFPGTAEGSHSAALVLLCQLTSDLNFLGNFRFVCAGKRKKRFDIEVCLISYQGHLLRSAKQKMLAISIFLPVKQGH